MTSKSLKQTVAVGPTGETEGKDKRHRPQMHPLRRPAGERRPGRRTRPLPVARRLLQHPDRRHRGLPRPRQSALSSGHRRRLRQREGAGQAYRTDQPQTVERYGGPGRLREAENRGHRRRTVGRHLRREPEDERVQG